MVTIPPVKMVMKCDEWGMVQVQNGIGNYPNPMMEIVWFIEQRWLSQNLDPRKPIHCLLFKLGSSPQSDTHPQKLQLFVDFMILHADKIPASRFNPPESVPGWITISIHVPFIADEETSDKIGWSHCWWWFFSSYSCWSFCCSQDFYAGWRPSSLAKLVYKSNNYGL